jgi:hypothetical protein
VATLWLQGKIPYCWGKTMKFNDRSMALLGVPDLPLNAFVRKASGGITPQSGGNTTNTTTQSTELPAWLKTYAEEGLKSASDLTKQPYQAFEGNRIAGFSPLQTQTQEAAANMTPSAGTQAAMGTTGEVAGRALGANYDAGQFQGGQFGGAEAQQYMNPYMQSVVDIQKREAQRQSGIQGTQQQAQAAQSGAFGGSRDAIMRAERERNLGTQMGDIQAQGSNLAFQQAQQQFNADQARRMQAEQQGEQSRQFGAGVGMQGLNTALSAAGQYGTLAGQEFQQGMDVNRLQNAYGAQQQALRQQGLTQSYDDFQRQQQDPYNKLSYMASLVRGTPGMTSTTTGSTPNPSFLQTAGSAATGLWGLSKFMAEGGSVDSQQNIEDIVRKLSDSQLNQAQQAAKARGDGQQLQIIAMEQAARASMKRGIGSVPVDMGKMMPTAESMARGGIVAFSGRVDSLVSDGYGEGIDDSDDDSTDTQGAGNADMYALGNAGMLKSAQDIQSAKYAPYTPAMRAAQIKRTRTELMEGMGASPYEAQRKEIEQMKADSAANLKQGKGLAALQAASAMLEGGNAVRGLLKGAGTFGTSYSEAVRADQAQKRALQNMQINLADAERKEKMGLNKEAIASANQAQKDQHAAQVFGVDKAKALGVVYRGMAAANKPAAVKAALPPKLAEQLAAAEIAFEKNPNDPEAKANVMGLRRAAAATRTSFSTAEAGPKKLAAETEKTTAATEEKAEDRRVREEADIAKVIKPLLDPEYQAAMAKNDQAGMAAAVDKLRNAERARRKKAVGNNSPAPTAAPARMKFTAQGELKP